MSVESLAHAHPRTATKTRAAGARRVAISLTVLLDLLACCGAYVLALLLHGHLGFLGVQRAEMHVDWSMLAYLLMTLGVFGLLGLYQPETMVSRVLMLRVLTRSTAVALVLTVVAIFLAKDAFVQQSRMVLILYFAGVFVFSAILRLAWMGPRLRGWTRRAHPVTLTVGPSPRMQVLHKRLDNLAIYTEDPVRLYDGGSTSEDVKALAGALEASRSRGSSYAIAFLDGDGMSPQTTLALADDAMARGVEVYVAGELVRELRRTTVLFHLFEAPVVRLVHPARGGHRSTKRLFDIAGSFTALVLLSPVLLAAALAIKLTSRGPAIFAQDRLGRGGRHFRFYKFRSMTVATPAQASTHDQDVEHRNYVKALIQGENGSCNFGDARHPVYKLQDDGRVTSVGKWLRRLSIDELPQFWNVLKGDMSLVGPRPALPYEVAEYKDWHRRRLVVRPGITGLWQVGGRSRVTFDEMVFQDVVYTYGSCVMTDISLCLRTIPAAIAGRGAA